MKKYLSLLVILLLSAALIEGFQCASKELTSAKVAIQAQDYKKAEDYLQRELSKNPNNEEALILLAEVKKYLNDYKGAADAINKAEKVPSDPKLTARVPLFKHQLWVEAFNGGIGYYNNYINTKIKPYLDTALFLYDLAISLRPEMENFYNLKGLALEAKGDTNGAIVCYKKYYELMEPEFDLSKEKSLSLDMARDEALKALGKPVAFLPGAPPAKMDSAQTDVFQVSGKEVLLYSVLKRPDKFRVKGWKVDPPKHWPDFERMQIGEIDLVPVASLAQYYYERKDYKEAMNYVKTLTQVDPSNSQYQAFLVELFQSQGKSDEAMNWISGLVKSYPDNKYYLAQYGDLLLTSRKYDDAITQYNSALKIDPEFDVVLRNAASAYKNKASVIQQRQQDSIDKNKKYQPNLEEYFPDLKKSAELFERSRKSERFKYDIDVLGELINIYEVLDDNAKIKEYLGVLEGLENDDEINKADYYRIMCKVYTLTKMNDKAKTACDKYKELISK